MTLDPQTERREIVRQLNAAARPDRSADLQSYLGSPYPVLGLSTPDQREVVRSFWKGHRRLTAGELNALAAVLWSGPTLEEKGLAISLLGRYAKVLDGESWKLADRWVDEAIGWALSDSLAAGPISTMVYDRPERFAEVFAWTRSAHFWRRRAATYAMRNFVFSGELGRPFRILKRVLRDPEFWVQRAVGTWLRECWKKDRRRTEAFLRRNVRGLPPVVITVATERAPKALREELRRNRGGPSPTMQIRARGLRPEGRSRRRSRASRRRRPSR